MDEVNTMLVERIVLGVTGRSAVERGHGVSNPLFIAVPDSYEQAALRPVIVGQQTHGLRAIDLFCPPGLRRTAGEEGVVDALFSQW